MGSLLHIKQAQCYFSCSCEFDVGYFPVWKSDTISVIALLSREHPWYADHKEFGRLSGALYKYEKWRLILPILLSIVSLALGQTYRCPYTEEATIISVLACYYNMAIRYSYFCPSHCIAQKHKPVHIQILTKVYLWTWLYVPTTPIMTCYISFAHVTWCSFPYGDMWCQIGLLAWVQRR